jgi:hypothetical protein
VCLPACLPAELQISDSGSGAVVEVHKAGFPDAVVWNPWIAKAQAMGDFGDEEYKVRHLRGAAAHTMFATVGFALCCGGRHCV